MLCVRGAGVPRSSVELSVELVKCCIPPASPPHNPLLLPAFFNGLAALEHHVEHVCEKDPLLSSEAGFAIQRLALLCYLAVVALTASGSERDPVGTPGAACWFGTVLSSSSETNTTTRPLPTSPQQSFSPTP